MKILIVNTYDLAGGAARATYRLHHALLEQDVDSQMLVIGKVSDDRTVTKLLSDFGKVKNRLRNYQLRFFNKIESYPNKTKTYFSTSFLSFSNIVDKINEMNPDIVHLHWICNEMIKIEDLVKIKAPIVWSLHDMWAFTGGCHYDEECDRYLESCGKCKVLGSRVENDLSKSIFLKKQKTFSKMNNMTIVGLSQWLSDCAKKSILLKNKKHLALPNCIDINVFKPFDQAKSRELWSLPKDKKLVLFGAMGATSDPRKGFRELIEALKKMTCKDLELVVFGSSQPENTPNFGFKTHYLGSLADDVSLVTLYSAVDVMVVPSLQEAFGQTASESMSCETPVVAFGATGLLDIVDHQKNGYLAKPYEIDDLAYGIKWVLENKSYDELCQNARKKIVREFDSVLVAKKYIKLYKDTLNNDQCNMSE